MEENPYPVGCDRSLSSYACSHYGDTPFLLATVDLESGEGHSPRGLVMERLAWLRVVFPQPSR